MKNPNAKSTENPEFPFSSIFFVSFLVIFPDFFSLCWKKRYKSAIFTAFIKSSKVIESICLLLSCFPSHTISQPSSCSRNILMTKHQQRQQFLFRISVRIWKKGRHQTWLTLGQMPLENSSNGIMFVVDKVVYAARTFLSLDSHSDARITSS